MEDINKPTADDFIYAIVKGGYSALPGIGPFASEFFSLLVSSPLESRRAKYLEDLAERLKKLEGAGRFTFEDLKNNDQFIDAILTVTPLVLKTSEEEKIEAFKNAIINTALGITPEKAISQIFIQTLDRFTVIHIKFLVFIQNPKEWFVKQNIPFNPGSILGSGTLSSVINSAFPELQNQDDLKNIVWKDLKDSAFNNSASLGTMMTNSGLYQQSITELGRQFLDFISTHEVV